MPFEIEVHTVYNLEALHNVQDISCGQGYGCAFRIAIPSPKWVVLFLVHTLQIFTASLQSLAVLRVPL